MFLTANQLTERILERGKNQRTCIHDPTEEGWKTKQNTVTDLFDDQDLKKETTTAKEPENWRRRAMKKIHAHRSIP